MIGKAYKTLTTLLLGTIALQVMLPVVVLCTIASVRQVQRSELSGVNKTKELKEIRISEGAAVTDYTEVDEFVYEGMMYDIYSVTKEKGEYVILALPDKKETDLQKLNAHIIKHHHDHHGRHGKVLPFALLYYETHSSWLPLKRMSERVFNDKGMNTLINFECGIVSPPPWMVC